MSYCEIIDARERLPDIDTSEYDSEIENCIEQAQGIVDDLLRKHTTVPLTGTIPATVKHGTADIAAAIFRSRRTPDGTKPPLYGEGIKRIESYIKSTYKSGTFTR